jgi:hypothetical protein
VRKARQRANKRAREVASKERSVRTGLNRRLGRLRGQAEKAEKELWASVSSEEPSPSEGSVWQASPLLLEHTQSRQSLLFPAVDEEHCEWCLHKFSRGLPFATAQRPGLGPPTETRSDLRVCTACVPLVKLTELLQHKSGSDHKGHGSDNQRAFVRSAVNNLVGFLKDPDNYPLDQALGGYKWTPPPSASSKGSDKGYLARAYRASAEPLSKTKD